MKLIYPAYGRELMRRRLAGQHPPSSDVLLVALGFWPRIGAEPPAWPIGRAVMIADDQKIARLELRMLAGAVLLVAFDSAHEARARELCPLLARLDPARGEIYALDFEAGRFWRVIAGDCWFDSTRSFSDAQYWPPLAELFRGWAARSRGNEQAIA